MKKLVLLALISFLAAGSAFAQWGGGPGGAWGGPQGWGTPPETTTVSGRLHLQNGAIVLVSGDTTYLVPSVWRLSGFIDGLGEGAQVSITGFVFSNEFWTVSHLRPTSITVGGRTYELGAYMRQGFCGGWDGSRGGGGRGGRGGGSRGGGGGWR